MTVPALLRAPTALGQPLMAVSRNPLLTASDLLFEPVQVGVSLASLRPEAQGPVRCTVNGVACFPITNRQWQHYLRVEKTRPEDAKNYLGRAIRSAIVWKRLQTQPGDIIVWHVVPQDSDSLKGIIALVVAVVYAYFAQDYQGAFQLFALVYGVANVFFPTTADQLAQQQGGTIYSTSLGGNQAKLDQPIWRNCGVVKITPPFAAAPYYEYIDIDGDNEDNDQYYYAVFAIGIGKHDVLRSFIGKTPISNYQDVLTATYLPPGTLPTRALCNVVTSTEVGGLELVTGEFVGPYAACQPGRKLGYVSIDVSCPQGLGTTAGGDKTVSWSVYWREIDEFGRGITPFQLLGSESRTASTATPQRWSNRYAFPGVVSPFDGGFSYTAGAVRAEVQVVRTDVKDTSAGARHTLQWDGLRGYLSEPAPLNADTSYYEVVMRASKQLGAQSQRDFSLLVQSYARTWSVEDGWSCDLHDWDNYTATRNPAWYLADLWVDPLWGEGRDEARINLQGLADFAAICATRQDRFDYTFADFVNAMDAAQLIAGAGRARAFERLGVITLARDSLVTMPRTAFSPRNTIPNSMAVTELTPRPPDLIDGIVLEYVSNVTWDIVTIDCPCPGYTVTSEDDTRYNSALPKMTRVEYLRIQGIKGAKHAERTGLYEAAKRFYRRRFTSCTTEMQGAVLAFMDAIRWQPEIGGFGQSGDVAFWDEDTLVMGLTEPLTFSDTGYTWLALMRDDGTLTTPVLVSPGPTSYDVILPAIPDFDMVLDSGTRERPKFFASHAEEELVRITSIEDGGKGDAEENEEGAQLYDINGFIDDARVHSAGEYLLPGPGEIQDPVDDGTGGGGSDGGGGVLALVTLKGHEFTTGHPTDGGGSFLSIRFRNDGTFAVTREGVTTELPNEWLLVPAEVSQAAGFEIYVSVHFSQEDAMSGSALATWLNLGTTRTFTSDLTLWPGYPTVSYYDSVTIRVRVQIREVATGIVQADRIINLITYVQHQSTGP